MTTAIAMGELGLLDRRPTPRQSRRFTLKRVLIVTGSVLVALIVLVGSWIGISLYRIDHAVHHVGVPASLLARGKNDLLTIVKGPDHSEQVFVFHTYHGGVTDASCPVATVGPTLNPANATVTQTAASTVARTAVTTNAFLCAIGLRAPFECSGASRLPSGSPQERRGSRCLSGWECHRFVGGKGRS